jgi:hypothetical protein
LLTYIISRPSASREETPLKTSWLFALIVITCLTRELLENKLFEHGKQHF